MCPSVPNPLEQPISPGVKITWEKPEVIFHQFYTGTTSSSHRN